MTSVERVRQVVGTRIKVARQWFGLRDANAIRDFVLADPEVQALRADKVVQENVAIHFIRRIAIALERDDHATLRHLEALLGREMFEAIVEELEAKRERAGR